MKWRRPDTLICLAILLVTACLYSGVRNFAFVLFDDPDYALAPQIRHGVTPEALKWAFTSGEAANWMPLTRLSHMLDYQFYGPASGPAHMTSVAIHIAASLMLFAFLRRATGAVWKSAFVAGVFAWHPLHVESVAWVAERKDVLCAFFWFLTLWLWVRYAERPGWARYLTALLTFCLGLMSKPMIVSLPLVLLLIDLWPLRRPFSRKLLFEKLPFAAIAAVGSAVTYVVQNGAGAVGKTAAFPLALRFGNVLLSYATYFWKTFWPARLAFWYPYPTTIDWWLALPCGAALLLVSWLALSAFRGPGWFVPGWLAPGWFAPGWFATGWMWFVVTLIPVIGIVQVGDQAHADRYMYIPMVGLLVVLAWGAEAAVLRQPGAGRWIAAGAALCCAALLPVTWFQIGTWRDNLALFQHATEVTSGNYLAYLNLGKTFEESPGGEDRAIACFRTALRIRPDYALAWYNLATIELRRDHLAEATADIGEALRLNPGYGEAQNNLGVILGKQGRWAEAVPRFEEAVYLSPKLTAARRNLGEALLKSGRPGEAVGDLEAAVTMEPDDAIARNMLGVALAGIPGRRAEAISQLREAASLDPGLEAAHANLGRLLSQTPDGKTEAIAELRSALAINPGDKSTEAFLAQVLGRP